MKQFLIVGATIISMFLIYYLITRRVIEKFIDSSAGYTSKVLIDETDIPELASESSIHDFLLEKDPKFLQEQLEIYDKTRTIMNKIIVVFANVSQMDATDSSSKDKQIDDAIQTISKQTFGESPRFCSAIRVKELLNLPGKDGLAPLFKCIPAQPDKYLLLLSFASKTIKGQLDSVQGTLGLQNISANADDLPPPSEVELSARRISSSNAEGFVGSASADAYISAYALPSSPNSNTKITSADADTATLTDMTSQDMTLENELAAWKAAYNTESLTRIKQYLKYCTAALRDIDDINNAGKDGSLIKRINLDKVRTGVQAQLEQRASSSASLNLPF